LLGVATQDPNSTIMTVLSLFPTTAPTMMMLRVSLIAPTATNLSFFSGILAEATLAFIIVVLFTIFMIWLTARIFRIGILMYGKRPTLPELMKWITHK
ncbi:MAG: hypothetical protein V3T31_07300, partial [candidate division Zixibacteria bacterium]